MKTGSLCTGYGGLDSSVHAVLGGELAWVADNDPDAAKVLACRYPHVPNLGDITQVDWNSVEPVDVLTAGFPCTDISCAGQRKGLREGNRSGLWFHVARVIAQLRPPLVVIENVKELLSERADSDMEWCPWCLGDLGTESAMRALGAVLADLASLGFDAEWVSLPAAGVGACHLRWRVFILGWPAADAERELVRRWHAGSVAGAPGATEGPSPEWQRIRADYPSGSDGALADSAGISEREPADEADAFTGRRGAWAVPRGGGTGIAAGARRIPAPDAERSGRGGRASEPQRGPEWGVAAAWHRPGSFGRYEAAVRHHERVLGRIAPSPVRPGKTGNPQLAPAFSEWMMGLPAGWVTGVPGLSRNAQLKVIGNGVMPQQGALALSVLLARAGFTGTERAA